MSAFYIYLAFDFEDPENPVDKNVFLKKLILLR